jgi:cysteine synthase
MSQVLTRPILEVDPANVTELQTRIDDRMRGVLGQYNLALERTERFDLERDELFDRVDSLVGNTPLIHVEDVGSSSILAKVESQNPTENHYDRVFPRTIRRLEEDGIINPGDELIEVTSGSGGRAFAWAAKVLGYRARVLVPPELPQGRVQDMINFGAEVEVTEPGYMSEVSKAYVSRISELETAGYEVTKHKTPDYTVFTAEKDGDRVCFVNHSANEVTVEGFDSIGEEIHEQMPNGEQVDFVVSVMGNGTSTVALSRTMRRHYPEVQLIGLEDERSPRYFSEKHPGEYERLFGRPPEFTQHDMFGSSAPDVRLKYGRPEVVDEIRLANPDERDGVRNEYNQNHSATYEQIGNSSAASLMVARQLAIEHPGSNIVIVFYDKADQYGDEPAFDRSPKFMGDRGRPAGVPTNGWRQQQVGNVALLPATVDEAYQSAA